MTATYLLHPEGLAAFAGYVAQDTLFAFDLDGTLAPIVAEYSAVWIAEPVRSTLERLVKIAKVVVITGRSRKDALGILGFEPELLVGNHGAEWPDDSSLRNPQFVQYCSAWRDQIQELLDGIQGVEIEFKGETLTIHYRKSIDQESTLASIDAAIGKLAPSPKRIGGKFVVNLAPMEALTKGEALTAAMDSFGLKRAIFFGDDVTDEEVFKLSGVDLFGIHIGKDDRTAASYYLNTQAEMLGILDSMVGMIELRSGDGRKP
jgi:trehalose 6-phosphate phosphatase